MSSRCDGICQRESSLLMKGVTTSEGGSAAFSTSSSRLVVDLVLPLLLPLATDVLGSSLPSDVDASLLWLDASSPVATKPLAELRRPAPPRPSETPGPSSSKPELSPSPILLAIAPSSTNGDAAQSPSVPLLSPVAEPKGCCCCVG